MNQRFSRSTQVHIPLWALVHLPLMVAVTTSCFTPKGYLHVVTYVLFENAMGLVKVTAVVCGLLTRALPSIASTPVKPLPQLEESV
jgi:hypothetical protein